MAKICPIMSRYIWQGPRNEDSGLHDVECLKEKCAWWDEKSKKCAFVSIASIARILGNTTV